MRQRADQLDMKIRGARDLSVPIAFALLGAAMCAGALLLPWVSLDLEAIKQWVLSSPMLEQARKQSAMSPDQLSAAMDAGMNAATRELAGELTGLKALRLTSVIAQVVSAGFVVLAVARFMNQGTTRGQLATELGIAGGFLMFRPVWTRTHLPNDEAAELFGSDVLAPAVGINVAIAGAALILLAAFMAQRVAASGVDAQEALEQQQAEMAARTGGGGYPAPAASAGMPVGAAHMATAAAVPTAYVPGGPPAYATPPAAPSAYAPPPCAAPPAAGPPAYAPPAYAPPPAASPAAAPPLYAAPPAGQPTYAPPAAPPPPHQAAAGASVPPPGFAG